MLVDDSVFVEDANDLILILITGMIEEVGCGGNEDVVGFRKLDRIRYKRIRGTLEVD